MHLGLVKHPYRLAVYVDTGLDVIMMYCFGRCYNRLAAPDFDAVEYDASHKTIALGLWIKHNIWILWIVRSLPDFIVKRLGRSLAGFATLTQVYMAANNTIYTLLINK